MNIQQSITKQINAGFGTNEIRMNLANEGYSTDEIDFA